MGKSSKKKEKSKTGKKEKKKRVSSSSSSAEEIVEDPQDRKDTLAVASTFGMLLGYSHKFPVFSNETGGRTSCQKRITLKSILYV